MSSATSITELRTMQIADLRKEFRAQQTLVRKMRLQIELNTEKDTARYRREKQALPRMLMVMAEKTKGAGELEGKPKTATVSAPKKPKKKSA